MDVASHIILKCISTASEYLSVDEEVAVVKIYSYINTLRVKAFKEICEIVEVEFQKMLGYNQTLCFALLTAVERALKLLVPIKLYFCSEDFFARNMITFFK